MLDSNSPQGRKEGDQMAVTILKTHDSTLYPNYAYHLWQGSKAYHVGKLSRELRSYIWILSYNDLSDAEAQFADAVREA